MDEEFLSTETKQAVNEVIWMYAHPSTTLKEAEQIAIKFYARIQTTWMKHDDEEESDG